MTQLDREMGAGCLHKLRCSVAMVSLLIVGLLVISPAIGAAAAQRPIALAGVAGSASAGGMTAYVANYSDGTVTPISTATNTPGSSFSAGAGPAAIAITPDGTTAYVADASDATLEAIDLSTHTVTHTITVGSDPVAIAITPNGTTAYVAEAAGSVQTIDLATSTVTNTINVGSNPDAIAITPDGKTVYVTCGLGSFDVVGISTASNTVASTLSTSDYWVPVGIAITPNSETAFVTVSPDFGSDTGFVYVIDLATNTIASQVTIGIPTSIAIAPDGQTAYVAAYEGGVSAINVATGTTAATIDLPSLANGAPFGFPSAIAITPDSATAYVALPGASVSSPGAIVPIDLATNTVGTPITVGVDPDAIAISNTRCLANPVISTNPSNQTVTAPGGASFTAAATNPANCNTPTVQWQVSTDGGASWSNDTTDSGNTTDTLSINPTSTSQPGNEYRAMFTNTHGATNSNAATLTVNAPTPPPSVTVAPHVSGAALVGATLSVSTGAWTGAPDAYDYAWFDCPSASGRCSQVGAGAASYVTGAGDANGHVYAEVRAHNRGGWSGFARSDDSIVPRSEQPGDGHPGTLSVGQVNVSGISASVPLRCSGHTSCQATVSLTVTETLKGNKLTVVSTAKLASKVVVLARVSLTLGADQSKTVKATLNAAGERLLFKRGRMKVKLTVTQSGRTMSVKTLAFARH